MNYGQLSAKVFASAPVQLVQVQLHWIEYFQGKWSNPLATDVSRQWAVDVSDTFDVNSDIYIHVSKEVDENHNEGALKVHLDFGDAYAFRITSKNCDPDFGPQYWEPPMPNPYNATQVNATLVTGSDTLQASFETRIVADGSGTTDTETILQTVKKYALLNCANPVAPPFLPQGDPAYQEAGGLVSPFFFKETSGPNAGSQSLFLDERTFFVQPSLTETVIQEWDGWAIGPSTPNQIAVDPKVLNQINVIAQVPVAGPVPVNPGDPVYSVFPMQNLTDWVTHPVVAISYGGAAIGKSGGIQVRTPAALSAGAGKAVSGVSVLGPTRATAAPGFVLVGKQGVNLTQIQAVRTAQALATRLGSSFRS